MAKQVLCSANIMIANNASAIVTFGFIFGKTQLLYAWCLGEGVEVTTKPTEGFNVERVRCGLLELLIWDVSDSARRRQFFQGSEVLVYVIDSSDRAATNSITNDVKAIIKERDLRNTPFLVIAAKQDKDGCMSVDEVRSQFEMIMVTSHNKLFVVGTSTNNRDSIQNALQTLCDIILGKC